MMRCFGWNSRCGSKWFRSRSRKQIVKLVEIPRAEGKMAEARLAEVYLAANLLCEMTLAERR
jgi:hypothetical protein